MKIDDLCERLAEAQAIRDTIAGQLKSANEKVEELRDLLLARMSEEGTETVRASGLTATITKTVVPQVVDWDKLNAYVIRHKAVHLFQRRLSPEVWREEVDGRGKPIPGVEAFERVGIRITKSRE